MRPWAGYGKNDPHIATAIAAGDLTADPNTGQITYRGRPVGTPTRDGYIVVNIRRYGGHGWVAVLAHRICWIRYIGPIPPGMVIRHRNGRHWDNRAANLDIEPAPGKVPYAFAPASA